MLKIKDLTGAWHAEALIVTDFEFQGIKWCKENSDAIVAKVKEQLFAQGCPPDSISQRGDTLYFGHQFMHLPAMPAMRRGVIEFNSKGYNFSSQDFKNGKAVYGEKPKADQLTPQGFIKPWLGSPPGHIEYRLLERVQS